jgi:hypothetical protein
MGRSRDQGDERSQTIQETVESYSSHDRIVSYSRGRERAEGAEGAEGGLVYGLDGGRSIVVLDTGKKGARRYTAFLSVEAKHVRTCRSIHLNQSFSHESRLLTDGHLLRYWYRVREIRFIHFRTFLAGGKIEIARRASQTTPKIKPQFSFVWCGPLRPLSIVHSLDLRSS